MIERGRTSDWIMDPKDCTFENLISKEYDCEVVYKIAKLYFEYDQESTQLRLKMYKEIDKIIGEATK